MGSKLNNGYVGYNELQHKDKIGYNDTDIKGIISGSRNHLEYEIEEYNRTGNEWERNPEWLDIPFIPEGEEKVYALVAVMPNSNDETNTFGLNFRDNYDVDWGDGTTGSYTSATTNSHVYDFNTLDPSTETSEGYRQALITVTPQAGNSLTRMYFSVTDHAVGLRSEHYKNFLDVVARIPNVSPTYLVVPNGFSLKRVIIYELLNSGSFFNVFYYRRGLEYVYLPYDLSNITSFYNTFNNCWLLKYVSPIDTSGSTSFRSMFAGCRQLKNVPKLDISNATTTREMFHVCPKLEYVPDLNCTTSNTDIYQMFDYNYNLKRAPIIGDTSAVTNAVRLFYNCFKIKEIPSMDLSSVSGTNAEYMFSNCYELEKINTITFGPSLTSMREICSYSGMLQTIDFQGTGSVTDFTSSFRSCDELIGITVDTSSATNMSQTFMYTQFLKKLPSGLDTSNVTNGLRTFYSMSSLEELKDIDLSNLTNASQIFDLTRALTKVSGVTGPPITHTWEYCPLEPDSIRNIINGLPTVVGQTVSFYRTAGVLSGGVTAGDIAVATGKGWTVTT